MKSRTVLKLKVKVDDEQSALLLRVAQDCRRGRNVGLEDWLLRQRGMPESDKQSRPGKPDKNGNPRSLSESTKIYHALRSETPSLNSQIHSTLAAQVNSNLSAKLDWRDRIASEEAKSFKRKDAILSYEARPPFFTQLEVPVPNKITSFRFDQVPVLRFWWGAKGESPVSLELSTRRLSTGYKTILHLLAAGDKKLADSRLVYRDDEWFWHLPVEFETEVRSDVEATLKPTLDIKVDDRGKQKDRPFRLDLPGRDRPWYIGDGRYLYSQARRLVKLSKEIGWRYRQRLGTGHGRKKVDKARRRRLKRLRDIVAEVRRRAIADVVRQCVRHEVGKLNYYEPTLPLRRQCWFDQNGIDWDWTRFFTDLKNAAARQGIKVVRVKYKMKDAGYGKKGGKQNQGRGAA